MIGNRKRVAISGLVYLAFSLDARADPEKHLLQMQAFKMSPGEAATLEQQLPAGAAEVDARFKLLMYYWSNQKETQAALHYLWLVERHPASELLEQTVFRVDELTTEDQRRADNIWTKHIANNPTNVRILANAAEAFSIADAPRAIELLEKVVHLDPKNPQWHEQLGQLCSTVSDSGKSINEALAKKAFASYEQALALKEVADRFFILKDAAMAALLVGETDKAKEYANELLDRAVQAPPGWNYGNAVHHGNLILGHIAFRGGRMEEAEEFLIQSGKTPGSPQLNSFGPNMGLALALLKVDRRARVIEYLQLCKKFWKVSQLDGWIQAIEAGGIPDFGANLKY